MSASFKRIKLLGEGHRISVEIFDSLLDLKLDQGNLRVQSELGSLDGRMSCLGDSFYIHRIFQTNVRTPGTTMVGIVTSEVPTTICNSLSLHK